MPLTLTLEGPPGASAAHETRTLSRGTLSIGRAAGNDWVLADPDRLLSKTHCVIAASGGRYVLTDLSTNGVFVNGASARVPRDGQVELTDGDEFRLGDYVIRANETAAAAPPPAPVTGHAPFAPGGRPHADPLADPAELGPDPLADPSADPLADPLDPFGASARAGFAHPIAAPPPALRAHDPFDLADEARPGRTHDLDDDLMHGITPVDQWQGPSQADNVDAPMQAFAAPKAILPSSLDDLDIDALLGDEPPPGSPAAALPPARPSPMPPPMPPSAPAPSPQAADPFLSEIDPFNEPLAAPPAAAPRAAPVPPPAPPPAAPVDQGRLLAAFLEGAGIAGLATGPDPEASMRAAGEVFRAMVEGIREVLISRAAIKNEFRVEQTMLRARDNNALKFSVTAEDALAALLGPTRPGYKAPVAAAREAFADVRSHEMAVMAGVQTALMSLLRRFEPEALEKRLEPGLLGGILPSARKARTWELFCTTYKEIAREAEDDFQSVFGREFARAYDAQMRKL
ncbi:MAG TPA: type VI secretion system-associated FHA domain protein TagH [Acetobacteraceae bacterium]|nr:type VI secretion system-associated FHA domain protein TagH [Acetobacteraceae bacterium]